MRWPVAVIYLVLAAATATAAVVAAPEDGAGVAAVAAEGGFALSNSQEGAAIFTAAGIGPEESAGGTVELVASGGAADLTLSRRGLADTPGLGGGLLSAQLQLRIRELGTGGSLYSGPLATMPPQQLGRLEPGVPRSFEFEATLPEAGAAVSQNAVQGATTSVAYAWTASAASEEAGQPRGEGTPPAGGPPGAADDDLDLRVTRVKRQIQAGRVTVWTNCDHPCAIVAKGGLRAHDEDDRRATKLRYARRSAYRAGPRRLSIRLSRGFRHWMFADPSKERGRARVRFVAWDASGNRDLERRTVRLRSAR